MSKHGIIEPRRLKGFRDYMPDQMEKRLEIMDLIRREAALAGFRSIGTPALEYAETLLGQGSDETDKQVYRFKDNGDRDVALRFDLTVPFARFVGEHQGTLIFPFKKLQIGDVWRGENTQKGRYREFTQCDLDIIGADTMMADIEVLSVFIRILSGAGCGGTTMALGNRRILSGLIAARCPGLTPAQETEVLIALDKLAKIGPAKVADLINAIPGAQGGADQLLADLARHNADGDSDLNHVRSIVAGNTDAEGEILRTEQVLKVLRQIASGRSVTLRLDLSVARGLGYYTGIVFETTLDLLPSLGSICSGGRYNDLASRFTTRELPGIGGSVGLDRLIAGMEELNQISASVEQMVFVAVATQDAWDYGFSLLNQLRNKNLRADIGLVPKLANQFRHADRIGATHVVTVGTSEVAAKTAALKDLKTGTEVRDLSLADLFSKL